MRLVDSGASPVSRCDALAARWATPTSGFESACRTPGAWPTAHNVPMLEVIGYQGEPGAYSEEACHHLFPGTTTVGQPTFASALAAVASGDIWAAVLPVENSLAGVVQEVSDLLWIHAELAVIAENVRPIRHCLLARDGAPVRRAFSHPQALAQCAGWLATRGITPVTFPDTAGAAHHISISGAPGDGAIASLAAAERYGLEVLAEDVADDPSNRTRFLVVAPQSAARDVAGPAKVAMGFVAEHRPGGLVQVLQVFAGLGLNLTRLDSRPVPHHPFHYRFYVDVELDDGSLAPDLLRALAGLSDELRLFGVYPRV